MSNANPYKHTQLGTVLIAVLALVLLVIVLVAPFPTWVVSLYAVLVILFGWLTVEINERFGVTPLSWTPNPLGEWRTRCQEQDELIHLSFASR